MNKRLIDSTWFWGIIILAAFILWGIGVQSVNAPYKQRDCAYAQQKKADVEMGINWELRDIATAKVSGKYYNDTYLRSLNTELASYNNDIRINCVK